MGFVHDRTSIGDFIAQHHDLTGNWVAEPNRRRQGRVRFLGYDKITGDPIYDRLGWDHGGVCWLPSWLGPNLSIGVWQQAFPALIMPASIGTQSGPKYDSKVIGPLAAPALKQENGIWVVDRGLQPQPGALPMGMDLPVGFPVVALGMSTLDEQQLALIPSGGILIAVKNGIGQGRFGTRVYDVTKDGVLDVMRWARDHSHWCVYLLPNSSPVGFRFGNISPSGGGQTVSKIAFVPPGGLAWELGPSVDGQAGHGVVTDIPSRAGAPLPAILDGPASTQTEQEPSFRIVTEGPFPNDPNNPSSGFHFTQKVVSTGKQSTGQTVSKPTGAPKTQEKPKAGVVDGAPPILAVSSYRGRGPLNVGQQDDPHKLATTPDGKPVNSLHEDEGAIVIGDTGDAPRKHDTGAWQSVAPAGPFAHEVFHRTDPSDTHEWMGKTLPGLRKWQGSSAESVPTPRGDVLPGNPINPGTREKKKKNGGGPGNPVGPGGPPGGGPPAGGSPSGGSPPGGDPVTPVLPPDVGPQFIGPDHLVRPFPLPIPQGDGPIPPGGYFDGTGRPLYPEYPIPVVPDAGDVGEDKFQPGEEVGSDAVEPFNPGGVEDGPVQRSYPARGPSMGFFELIPRGIALDPNNRDPRYQFDPYTPTERAAFDNAPAGARIAGFSEQSGGAPTLDGPACGPANIGTGTSPRGGISVGPSDFDLHENLKRRRRGEDPLHPRNEALITFEEGADAAWGDTLENGKPANGFRIGRSWDELTELLYMSLDQTQGDGSLVDGPPAILVDFVNEIVELWGSPIVTGTIPVALQSGLFGDGSDGAAVFDGGAAPAGTTFDGIETYTATRDLYYTTCNVVDDGITSYHLKMDGWRLFVNDTLTVSSHISNDGFNGTGVGTPGSNGTPQTVGYGRAGGAGVARSAAGGTNGSNGVSVNNSFGGTGGAGGQGNPPVQVGGAGGVATAPASNYGDLRQTPQITMARLSSYQGDINLEGGAGGGSGGNFYNAADSGTHTSGGGGGGAGVLMIAARRIISPIGLFSANGGQGGGATTTGSVVGGGVGGGGGGGGGLVILVYGADGSTVVNVQANGGIGGGKLGLGNAGFTGSAGRVYQLAL